MLLKLFVLSPYSTTVTGKQYIFLFLNTMTKNVKKIGAVTISPSPRAAACHVGNRLQLMCNSTDIALLWRLTLLGMAYPTEISISSTTVAIPRVMINSSRVTVSRTSERGAVPLISILEIRSVSDSLNGTLNVTCMEFGTSMVATITVYIAGSIQGKS